MTGLRESDGVAEFNCLPIKRRFKINDRESISSHKMREFGAFDRIHSANEWLMNDGGDWAVLILIGIPLKLLETNCPVCTLETVIRCTADQSDWRDNDDRTLWSSFIYYLEIQLELNWPNSMTTIEPLNDDHLRLITLAIKPGQTDKDERVGVGER